MSNALAIATVTSALAQIIRTAVQSTVAGSDVLTERPDSAPLGVPRVRLFLYQATPNGSLRNNDLPTRAADGTLTRRPTAALDLHYLMAFYGNETNLEPQRMLGAAVRDLHGKPVLTRQMILDAVAGLPALAGSNLADSVEQVKFTPSPLSLEELSKLWSVFFQAPYALSLAYQANVVLIEGEEGAPTPLPVLRRGELDRGVDTALGPFPGLDGVHVGDAEDVDLRPRPPSRPAAQLGSALTFRGRNLGGEAVSLRFEHSRLPVSLTITIQDTDRSPSELRVVLPSDAAAQTAWAAGLYSVTAMVKSGGVERATNQTPLSLAAKIQSLAPNPVTRDAAGDAALTVTCAPQVRPGQRALLLVGDRQAEAAAHPADTDTLQFKIEKAPALTAAPVHLRVDGVDSLPFKRAETPPPPHLEFDDAQRVTIQ